MSMAERLNGACGPILTGPAALLPEGFGGMDCREGWGYTPCLGCAVPLPVELGGSWCALCLERLARGEMSSATAQPAAPLEAATHEPVGL